MVLRSLRGATVEGGRDVSGWFWLSSRRMTFAVYVSDGLIRECAPIARKFIGQRPEVLGAWMRKQGGFEARRLS